MSSDTALSVLSQYVTTVALIPTTAALVLTERGWTAVTSMFRAARTTVRPSESTCARRFWSDVRDDGEVHVCTHGWPSCQCQCQLPHVSGDKCWERTIGFINNWRSPGPELCDKPSQLQLSREYLHVDGDLVRAFVFLAVTDGNFDHCGRYRSGTRDVSFGGIVINRQVLKKGSGQNQHEDTVLLHLLGSIQRNLAKKHLDMVLGGGPPLLPGPWRDSISTPDDMRRGGWIVAVGLMSHGSSASSYRTADAFLPVYVDSVAYKDNKRGGVFWQSIDRVTNMLTEIWLPAFETHADACHVKSAIKALEYMRQRETESGVNNIFDFGIDHGSELSRERQQEMIHHFNGPPVLAESQLPEFRRRWEPLLRPLLVAAVGGTWRCVVYFKNPGRELHYLMPDHLLDSPHIYVRGC